MKSWGPLFQEFRSDIKQPFSSNYAKAYDNNPVFNWHVNFVKFNRIKIVFTSIKHLTDSICREKPKPVVEYEISKKGLTFYEETFWYKAKCPPNKTFPVKTKENSKNNQKSSRSKCTAGMTFYKNYAYNLLLHNKIPFRKIVENLRQKP